MTVAAGQFDRVVGTVAERTAELLGAHVRVVDDRGVTVADSRPPVDAPPGEVEIEQWLEVPLSLRGWAGEVVVARPVTGEVVSPRLAQALVELVINQTAVVERLPNQHELKNKFIHDLLSGAVGGEANVLREAQILGMDLTPPRAVILVNAADYILAPSSSGRTEVREAQVRRRVQHVIAGIVGFFMLPNDTICGYIGNGEVAVLKASTTRDLETWVEAAGSADGFATSWANLVALKRAADALLTRLRSDTRSTISVGIGRYHPGLRGYSQSYQDARAALSLGSRFNGENRVHCLDELGIPAFIGVSDEQTKIDLAAHLLSPLDPWPELLDTLSAFFGQNCLPLATAKSLSIHRNTLSYRLDKIASLTGLDPRKFDEAVQIRLALTLRSLRI